MRRDPWAVLGLAPGATRDGIRRAFRRLAWELHPDRRPGDPAAEARFKELVDALDALSARRAKPGGRAAAARAPAPATKRSAGRPGTAQEGGAPHGRAFAVTAEYEISLREALRGGPHAVRLRTRVPCAACEGGARRRAACPACHGTGAACVARKLVLQLPAGLREGDSVTVAAAGAGTPDAENHASLRVRIMIRTQPGLRIDGNDLHLELPLTVDEAFFGSRLAVPTPNGDVLVTLPPITGTVPTLRVRGRGLPPRAGRAECHGDLLLHPVIVLPTRRDAAGETLVRRLAAAYTADPRATLHRCFD